MQMVHCGTCKESIEYVVFERKSYNSQRQPFFDYQKQVIVQNAFEVFFVAAFSIKLYFVWEKNKVCWQTVNVVLGMIE